MPPKRPADDPSIAILLQLLDQAYDRKSWHGPNLKGSLRRVVAAEAVWRVLPGRRSIAEIAVHCAYWKYAAWRRLRGEKRGSFPLKGSNWFAINDPLDEKAWKEYLKLLESCHLRLRAAVAEFSPMQLNIVPLTARTTNLALIEGIAAHDIYHAGQIQLLKRLYQSSV